MKRVFISIAIIIAISVSGACQSYFEKWSPKLIVKIQDWSFVNDRTCWLVDHYTQILYTQNQGNSWQTLKSPYGSKLDYISFIDENIGWGICEDGGIFKSLDQGHSWDKLGTLGDDDKSYKGALFGLRFLNEKDGFLSDSYSVWTTKNGGRTWERHLVTNSKNQSVEFIYSSFYKSSSEVWVGSDKGTIYYSKDAGVTWNSKVIAPNGVTFNDIYFANDKFGWLASYPTGMVYITKDGGRSWEERLNLSDAGKFYIRSVYFTDEREGWAVGMDTIESAEEDKLNPDKTQKGRVFHSADGGLTWKEIETGINEVSFDKIIFVNHSVGWLLGRNNLYRIDNGGSRFIKTIDFN